MYEQLREMALRTTARDLGLAVTGSEPFVFGVVMDMDIDGETATLVSFETGDASLYLSTGGGMIGGGAHPNVAEASRRLVAAARPHLQDLSSVHAFPRPGRGGCIFYVLTTNGVFAISESVERLAGGASPLSPLFAAGNEALAQLRLVQTQP